MRASTWAAIVLAALGVATMVIEGLAAGRLFGNLMGLAAALTFAAMAIIWRIGRRLDMMTTLCLGGFFAALAAAGLAEDWSITRHDLAVTAVMGTVQVSLGSMLMTYGSRHVPAAELTLFSLVEVVLGSIWVWLVIDEVPAPMTLVGGAMVLVAIAGNGVAGIRASARENRG